MPRKRLNLDLSHAQYQDLDMALEDHYRGLQELEVESMLGLGLEPAYWRGRVKEVAELRKMISDNAVQDSDQDTAAE